MRRIFMSPAAILQRSPGDDGGGATLEQVNEAIKGLKTGAEKAQEALKKQISDLEDELKKKAASEDITAAQEALKKAQTDLVNLNSYVEKLEKRLNEKPIEQKFKSFSARIGEAVVKSWDKIKNFADSNPGARLRIELFTPEEIKAAGDMGLANITDLTSANTTVIPGIQTLPNTRNHVRDLLPKGTMTNTSITYLRETGGEGAPEAWSENSGEKTQFDADMIEIVLPAEYIAGYVRVSRKLLDDIAAFRSFLQMRMLEKYLDAEDEELMNGNNTSPHLTGLLTNATVSTSTSTISIERIIDDIAAVELAKYSATAIMMNSADFYEIAKNKASGSGEYDLPGIVVIQGGQLYVAGVPVFKTTVISQGTYLVGDFARECLLYIRENPRIEFFDQDRDNVITNKITVRIEGRAGLAIFATAAFVKGTMTAST